MTMERFHYEVDGKKIDLPKFGQCKGVFGMRRRLRNDPTLSEEDLLLELIEANASARVLKVLDTMSSDQTVDFLKKWTTAAGVTPGESRAS